MSLLTRVFILSTALCGFGVVATGCDDDASQTAPADPGDNTSAVDDAEQTSNPPPELVHPPADPRAALSRALASGLLQPDMTRNDQLRAVLSTAGVPEASQVLVFSKTSMQSMHISASRPRALYFNDDCYIGYVPGGLIEFGDADTDPTVGSGFFQLDPRDGLEASLQTNDTCLNCHGGSRTYDRPGFLVRSVYPDVTGFPITSAGTVLVGHHTPINQRWGGWYVTGNSGSAHHRGNQAAIELPNGDAQLDPALGSNVTDLSPYFDTTRYLEPTSDIVALMVLEHQVVMHNLLTQGGSVVHERIIAAQALANYLDKPFVPAESETLQIVINSNVKRIVEHLLYCSETQLQDPIVGGDAFQQAFRANRREDSLGRSLKDFDLQTHLFRYRCSYMIYSRAFELMPDLLKDAVLAKLRGVLTGEDDDPAYDHLPREEREVILAILQDTGVL